MKDNHQQFPYYYLLSYFNNLLRAERVVFVHERVPRTDAFILGEE